MGSVDIIRMLQQEYDIESARDIHYALKDLLGGAIKEMMETEIDDHLGYGKSERSDNDDSLPEHFLLLIHHLRHIWD